MISRVLLLLVLPLLSVLPVRSADLMQDSICYNLHGEELSVTHFPGMINAYHGEVVVPASVFYEGKEYPVTSVEESAFEFSTRLTAVQLPNTVRELGMKAFKHCNQLTRVQLPAGIKVLPEQLFDSCIKLEGVDLPESLVFISAMAFAHCGAIRQITVPDGVVTIGREAFDYCHSLEKVILGTGIKTIGSFAFSDCLHLKTLEIHALTPPSAPNLLPIADRMSVTVLVPQQSASAYRSDDTWKWFTIQ